MLNSVEHSLQARCRASRQRDRQRRSLPKILVVDLRDRAPIAGAEDRLDRCDLLPLRFQATAVFNLKLDLKQSEERQLLALVELALDLLGPEGLDHVAYFDVLEIVERQPAFES